MKTMPTLREKKRYIAFEINSEKTINRQELVREISNSIISLFGDKGASEINPSLMSFEGRFGILRCAREKTNETRAGLACINNIHGILVSILYLAYPALSKVQRKSLYNNHSLKSQNPKKG